MSDPEVHHSADTALVEGGIMSGGLVAPDDSTDCEHPVAAIMWNPYNGVTQCHRCGQVQRPAVPYDPVPDGYHLEVLDNEPNWKYDPGTGRICRQMKCKNPGVGAINRGWTSHKTGKSYESWWYYCAEHLYGRWIEGGKLCRWILVADEDA